MVSLLEGDRGRDRVRRCRLLTSFQEGLEGDRGRDQVQQCRSFQEGPHQNFFFQNSASKMAKSIVEDIVNSHVITGKLLATHF